MPTISVIVPVYNVEQYLDRCVESILSQTFTDFELILVDDGSPDRSGAMCDEYAQKDSRIRVIHQENQGQAAARNHGVEIAKGEWISFVDSDDYIHPQMLEVLCVGVISSNAQIAMCSSATFQEVMPCIQEVAQVFQVIQQEHEKTLKRLIETGGTRYWIPCAKLIDASIVRRFPFTEGRVYEDNAIVFKWLHSADRMVDISETMYFYYQNPEGTTQSTFSIKRLDYLWALKEQIAFFEQMHYESMLQIIGDEFIRYSCDYYVKAKHQLGRKDIARQIRKDALRVYKQNRKISHLTLFEQERFRLVMFPWRTIILNKIRVLIKKL